MNKKIKLCLFVFIFIGVIVLNITYKNKDEVTKTKRQEHSNLAIMVKSESGEYISSDEIPKGNYILNEEKTICENNGKVLNYDSATGKVSFSFVGSDRCSLYFDKIIDTEKPVISNLTINDTTVTATLTDNESLSGYGISTSNSTEPTSWTSISGTSYNLSITITTEGTYYLWVKDSAGNKAVSEIIDLVKYGWKTILANNTVNETTPNFANTATTNEGLFKADDDLGTSYYFRGAVNNNWVKFGKDSTGKDIYWRIIRINGDGSIRMIYSGTTAPRSSTATIMTGTGTQINSNIYAFNSDYYSPSCVGYMYATTVQHGNTSESTIKKTIDNWYKTTTLETDISTKTLVLQNQAFCNDRSAAIRNTEIPGEISGSLSTTASYYYGAYIRLYTNKSPKLTCTTESDKFTLKTSSIGNKTLDYPVGLITADEVAMAGGVYGTNNTSYYLYTNQGYWSGTPNDYNTGYGTVPREFLVESSGRLSSDYVRNNFGVRPVISLSSSVKLSGDGTYNNVYTVS